MSTSLYWRPAPKEVPPARVLPYELKKAIAQRMFGHDGSLCSDEIEVGTESLPYLEGLADGRVEGAAELIGAIHLHGSVLLRIGEW